jgi:hypothetical protein
VRNELEYVRRFAPFSDEFFQPFSGKAYPLDYAQQGMAALFPDERLQVLMLNSAWEIDEFHRRRASVNNEALATAIQVADQQCKDAGICPKQLLRIGVWHHAVQGQYQMENTDFLRHLQKNGVKLGLHGDVHEFRREWIGYWHPASSLHIVGAGSFASPREGRKESIPRLYNLIEIRRDFRSLRVHTRAQEQPDGAWEGWNKWPSRINPESTARFPYFDAELDQR